MAVYTARVYAGVHSRVPVCTAVFTARVHGLLTARVHGLCALALPGEYD